MGIRSRIFYEVSSWASRRRDSQIISPVFYTRDEAKAFREGYYSAMNEVSQHFNMERIKAEKEKGEGKWVSGEHDPRASDPEYLEYLRLKEVYEK